MDFWYWARAFPGFRSCRTMSSLRIAVSVAVFFYSPLQAQLYDSSRTCSKMNETQCEQINGTQALCSIGSIRYVFTWFRVHPAVDHQNVEDENQERKKRKKKTTKRRVIFSNDRTSKWWNDDTYLLFSVGEVGAKTEEVRLIVYNMGLK